ANAGQRANLALPILLLPLLVPILLATIEGAQALLAGDPAGALPWLVVLLSEGALFGAVGLLTYELVAAPE
ncbi:MAG: hypothetical protein ACRDGQ_03205, partial [Candidatus Limnocylindrales bacterium]